MSAGAVLYAGAIGLFLIGFYAMVAERHLIRNILGLALVESGVNLLLVAVGFRDDAAAPILKAGQSAGAMVDPLPQALVLTAIVIGFGVLALALALVVRVYQAYGTLDARKVAQLMRAENAAGGLPAVKPQAGAKS